ncbi:hypothetical protein [Anatilimnocola floriformis]|uniref:hypothetical protein n=1 Tax=Anatilimnocola floriformis TaxID=2948575 RepID=UPI0020C59438|nr:hypothetical protein [Anatilimnocola floriformis]
MSAVMRTAAATQIDIALVRRLFGKRSIVGMIGLCLLLAAQSFAAGQTGAEAAAIDDGWRRTKFGWENIRDWNLPPEQLDLSGSAPIAPAILSPTAEHLLGLSHPLAVAVGLSLIAAAALRCAAVPELSH